jgi:hypothetical protein
MQKAHIPPNETQRLQDLYDCNILDTPAESAYDNIVAMAAGIFKAPICAVSLIDSDRQWLKAKIGINIAETPRDISFCAHTILQDRLMVVPDARDDIRFFNNPMVSGHPGIRFYAGCPIKSPGNNAIATLCIMDFIPRQITREQETQLETLGEQLSWLIELRFKDRALSKAKEFRKKLGFIMTKDIKSSLASIGTLLHLLQQYENSSKQYVQFTEMAIAEFQKKYSLYCLFTEWCAIYDHDHTDRAIFELSPTFFSSLTKEIMEGFPTRKNDLTINWNQGLFKDSGSLHFIIKATAFILANSAYESKIAINFMLFENMRATIEIELDSGKPIRKIDDIIRNFNKGAIWLGETNALLPFPEIAMVKDILEHLNGQIVAQAIGPNKIQLRITL